MAKSDLVLVQEIARRKEIKEVTHNPQTFSYLLREGQRYSLLTEEEESALLRIVHKARNAKRKSQTLKDAERQALTLLVMCNLRLVFSIIKSMSPPYSLWEDLAQEGVIGLLRAIRGYNPEYGCRFPTYAFFWIRLRVQRACDMEMETSVKRRRASAFVSREWERLAQEHKRLPDPHEIETIRKNAYPRSSPPFKTINLGTLEDTDTLEEKFPSSDNVEEECDYTVLREAIDKVLRTLDERSEFVLRAHYGIGMPPMSSQEIASVMKVSVPTVQRAIRTAIGKLRHPQRQRQLREYL